ncbi:MAG: M48 family metalloprotease [Mailhella sp.]|nr:M48 family metalloprotease [Mailhella sp.]
MNILRSIAAAVCMLGIVLSPVQSEAFLFSKFGLKEEMEMGREFEVLVKSSLPIIEDPEIRTYAQSIVDRIVKQLPPQPYKFPTNVVLHKSLNAFAAPGGFVFVFSGLIMNLNHESELAGVLAHEIAHVTQRHIAGRIERGKMISMGSLLGMVAGIAAGVAGDGSAGGAAMIGSMAATKAATLNYSRLDEDDADRFGLQYLVKAGYNPRGLSGAFEVMRSRSWGSVANVPAYLTTHPAIDMRLTTLRSHLETMPRNILARKDDDRRFLRVQTLLWARYGDTDHAARIFASRGDRDAVNLLGKAMLAARQNKVKEAEKFFTRALSLAPKDELILREAGIFEYEKGDITKARRYLQQALKIAPRDYYGIFYYARLLDDSGDSAGAQSRYREVLRYVPEDSEVHTYYGRSLGASQKLCEGYLHLAYASLYNGNVRKAASWLSKAKASAKTKEEQAAIKAYEKKAKERAKIIKEAR